MRQEYDWRKLSNLKHLSDEERTHLRDVYGLLLFGILVTALTTAFGIYAINYVSVNLMALLSLIGYIASTYYITSTSPQSGYSRGSKGNSRVLAFTALSSSTGLGLVPAILYLTYLSTHLVVTAFMATASIFVSLTLAALFARRRSMLWLGSILGTMVTYMLLGQLFGLFFPTAFLFDALNMMGMIMGLGFVLFDTQMMIETHRQRDVVQNAVHLYLDFANIFIHIVQILTDRAEERRKDKRSSH